MKKLITILITLLIFQLAAVTELDKQPIILGEKITIHSEILAEDRTFLINLPSNYQDSEENYPVLFQIQGSETLFHKATGEMRYLCESLEKIPPMIVVNILFTNYRRDIFPVVLPRVPGTGGSDNFLKFIETELMPYLDENYRTSDYRLVFGQSNTGMFTLYSLLAKPELFESYIASSPSVGQGDSFMYQLTADKLQKFSSLPKTLFITHALDDPLKRIVGDALPDYLRILKENVPSDLTWKYQEYETGGHCPQITLQHALAYIFYDWEVGDETIAEGTAAVEMQCKELKDKYGISPDKVSIYHRSAIDFMRSESYDLAFEYFSELRKLRPDEMLYAYQIGKIAAITGLHINEGIENLRIYISQENENANLPKSSACWRLGMIYETMGDLKKAKSAYQKGLLLDENDSYCKAALDKLETQE